MAYLALGEIQKARSYFNRLISYGKQHLHDNVTMDYFAVSLPDLQVWDGNLDTLNRIHCFYMLALGYAGLALACSVNNKAADIPTDYNSMSPNPTDMNRALRYLSEAEALDINHQGITSFKTFLNL